MNIEKKGKTADIQIVGDIVESRSRQFVKNINELVAEDIKRFNFDFSAVSLIDSNALSSLIVICDQADLEFTFKNVNKTVANVFDMIKLNKQVLIEKKEN